MSEGYDLATEEWLGGCVGGLFISIHANRRH
jgi:hypothetical protein